MEELSFDPANFGQSPTTPECHEEHSPQGNRHCSFTHQQLVFTSSDDESPVRPSGRWCQHSSTNDRSPVCRIVAVSSPEHHSLCHYLTPTQTTEQFSIDLDSVAWDNDTTSNEEHFSAAPLDDEVWSEDPIPDRSCASIRHLMSQITSGPTPVHTAAQPSE